MSIFNVFLDSPMLTVSVILFATCVVIGFFGDRYFKKHGTTIIKPSPKQTDETKVVKIRINKIKNILIRMIMFGKMKVTKIKKR